MDAPRRDCIGTAGRATRTGAPLGDFQSSLDRLLPTLEASEVQRLEAALRAALAGYLRARIQQARIAPSRLRERVERVIQRNIGSARLDTARIAALAGISRSALYRLFSDGPGIAAHVRRLRLARIHDDLSDPAQAGVAIAAIAERSGLHCVTSFNRAFRRAYGVTPSEVRAAALDGQRWATPMPLPGGFPVRAGEATTYAEAAPALHPGIPDAAATMVERAHVATATV